MSTTLHAEVGWDWQQLRSLALREAQAVLGSGESAQDAAQEATIRAWRHRRRCRTPEAPRGWVRIIARREALRAATARRPEEPEVDVAADEDAAGAAALRIDVRRAVRTLGELDRELVHLHYWCGLTCSELAAELGLPEGTVKVRLHRARAKLRRSMVA